MNPIGIFDSGYGGLTVFRAIAEKLPQYDYLYLGDNARAPYGNRSFETVYEYTLECVQWLFAQGCPLVILACNTASAKALRSIQQNDLPLMAPNRRVLGVIRPSAEVVGAFSASKKVGVLATKGTVASGSYVIEIANFYPDVQVYQQACPLWVPFIESGEYKGDGADYYVQKDLEALFAQDPAIDTVLLGCTHYPLLLDKIRKYLPHGVEAIAQGALVADSLADYLQRRPEMDLQLSKGASRQFYTTDNTADFMEHATTFFGEAVAAHKAVL
ncbi:MAG: glutamate racemase [Edaphocola sp.]